MTTALVNYPTSLSSKLKNRLKNEIFVFKCNDLPNKTNLEITDTIFRKWVNKYTFKETGYFNLDTSYSYNQYKIFKDRWYFKNNKRQWELFYYPGIKDTIHFFTQMMIEDGFRSMEFIINIKSILTWEQKISINNEEFQILKYTLLSKRTPTESLYIFDPRKGIVGKLESNGNRIDTCWRQPL